jgi:hypothetical protein
MLAASSAHAFDDPGQFFAIAAVPHTAAVTASAEGVYFTGAPRWSSLDCSSCHTDGPQKMTIRVGADDPNLFTLGYEAGRVYELEIVIGAESEGLQYNQTTCTEPPAKTDKYTYVPCNNNSFGLEIDDAAGPVGKYCSQMPSAGMCPMPDPDNDEVVVAPGGDAVFGNRQHSTSMPKEVPHNDPTRWHLWWTAPVSGSGPVTLYTAAVDGNGGLGTAAVDQDPFGDDTVRATVAIQERGAVVPTGVEAGCDYSGSRSTTPSLIWLLLISGLALRIFRSNRSSIL